MSPKRNAAMTESMRVADWVREIEAGVKLAGGQEAGDDEEAQRLVVRSIRRVDAVEGVEDTGDVDTRLANPEARVEGVEAERGGHRSIDRCPSCGYERERVLLISAIVVADCARRGPMRPPKDPSISARRYSANWGTLSMYPA